MQLHRYISFLLIFSEPLEPVVSSAQVSPKDLRSVQNLMSDFRDSVRQNLSDPISCSNEDAELLLVDVSEAMDSYLSEVLQPITTALG